MIPSEVIGVACARGSEGGCVSAETAFVEAAPVSVSESPKASDIVTAAMNLMRIPQGDSSVEWFYRVRRRDDPKGSIEMTRTGRRVVMIRWTAVLSRTTSGLLRSTTHRCRTKGLRGM